MFDPERLVEECLMHGFLTMTATKCVNAAIAEMAAQLRKGLG